MHTVIVDQAALDRHKTFTVRFYMMHTYKKKLKFIARYCTFGVFAVKISYLNAR